jgi:hypothetical protein
VLYYWAVSQGSKDVKLAISPDKLDEFLQNPGKYIDEWYVTIRFPERTGDSGRPTPPPFKGGSSRLSGPRFPTAPGAWKGGIVLFPVARNQLPLKEVVVPNPEYFMWLEFEFLGKDLKLVVVPHVTGWPDDTKVLFYSVKYWGNSPSVYVVSPNQIDNFADNAGKLLFAASIHYPRTEYEVETARMMHHATRGEVGDMVKAWGRSWKAAVNDPEWWIVGPILGLGLGAAARHVLAGPGAKAMQRLQQTQANLLDQEVKRSARVLGKPEVFRQTITADIVPVSYARIEKEGALRMSQGAKAHYGEGTYVWPKDAKGVGKYVDVEVAAGTAVETIQVKGQTFYRLVPSQGQTVSVKIVGTNLSQEELAFGRRFVAGDPGDMMDDVIAPPPPPKK